MIKAAELLFKAHEAREADHPAADRPQRARRPDAARTSRRSASANVAARRQHRGAQQAAAKDDYRGHRRLDDPQVPRHAGEPQHADEHLRADRRSPPHDRRRPRQLPDGGASQRHLHRLHRHAGGQDGVRQGHVQDLRHDDDKGTCTSTRSRRASRTARRFRSTTTSRPTRCWSRTSDGEGIPGRWPRPRGSPTSRS